MTDLALGKKLGVIQDRRTFQARALLEPSKVRVPARHRVGGQLQSVPVFGNDQYGNCVFASQGHAIITMERSASQRELPVSTDQILQEYADVTGFKPDDPSTDNGAYELDGLNNWRTNGIGLEKDGTPHKLHAYATVDWLKPNEVTLAHYVFGGLKVCAGLPLSAADQMRAGQDWTVTTGPRARWGSLGGHSMYSHAFDVARGLAVWTWGEEQWMGWDWIYEYVDECFALVSEDYLRRGGTTPQGLNMQALNDHLAGLGS